MKKAGIWIDRKKAVIIRLDIEDTQVETHISKIENTDSDFSGSKDFERSGAQEIVKDRRVLEIKKHSIKNYFKQVSSNLEDLDSIVIYGPADIPLIFNKELESNYPNLHKKVVDVLKADSMTDNQIKAMVSNYYKV
ncbi:hypothetical protein BC962_1952 [Gillisia mitskevichiae]|uniref:Protein required for attachment to host cells n=1 Tax=Gillisia mitskevichiae TaxID=270921 RepID=A0A495PW43_9FLAO|nr:hypothetical protein [Gillisia mitskevichiae]RKS53698.1 hypothetical protein BC962_1952 [Gillisia mitskevichiae]